jgi:predicted TIM-barrel fold metal-dependent hydrolase
VPTTHNSGLETRNSQIATQAIDVLFHPISRTDACRNLPPSDFEMDAAGIRRVLVAQCKRWSCERQWMCVDTRLDHVLRYTDASARYVGLAGYNPFDIAESLREIGLAVTAHAFCGVFIHAASFSLALTDPRMYPLFAKAAEMGVPVLLQSGPVRRADLDRLTADFPELPLVIAQPAPDIADLTAAAEACENVYFALDSSALVHLIDQWTTLAVAHDESCSNFFSEVFQQRCMWGSNGQDWRDALRTVISFPLLSETKSSFLCRNAECVFALGQPPASRQPRSVITEVLAAER